MDLVWLVYGISLLSSVGNFFTFLVAVSGCALVGFLTFRGAECSIERWDDEQRIAHKTARGAWAMGHVKTALKVMIPSMLILTFLPSERTAYIMVGAYATQKVAESGAVQETGSKVLTIINQKLDSYIEEGINKVEEEPKKKRHK